MKALYFEIIKLSLKSKFNVMFHLVPALRRLSSEAIVIAILNVFLGSWTRKPLDPRTFKARIFLQPYFLWATVVTKWESTKPHLCSKFSLFKLSWWMLWVLPQLCPLESSIPYLRAFQWGTVWPCNYRGFKNISGQS